MKKLKKSAIFTDIHWGCKSNSDQHNQDNLRYIDWFSSHIKNDPDIDHIMFLGDWFECRSALNISTLTYADEGMRRLRELKLPIFFVVGNHDLYQRATREIHSPVIYKDLEGVNIIDTPTIIPNIGTGILMCPYMFHEEYPELARHLNLENWFGHFEFKGFEVTGGGLVMPVGPEPTDFSGPKHIFSGHFHKRQASQNIIYVGNVFPTNFGDAGDAARGMTKYDHKNDIVEFIDWPECPMYIKTELSKILDGKIILPNEARVKVLVDTPISFEESNFLKKHYTEKSKLRELVLEESPEITAAITDTEIKTVDMSKYDKLSTVDELVRQMLEDVESDHIDNQKLIQIYTSLTEEFEPKEKEE